MSEQNRKLSADDIAGLKSTLQNIELETMSLLRMSRPRKGFRVMSKVEQMNALGRLTELREQKENILAQLGQAAPSTTSQDDEVLARSMSLLQQSKLLGSVLYKKFVVSNLAKWHYRKRKVLQHPHPTLMTRAEEWTDFSEAGQRELSKLVVSMMSTLSKQTYGQKLGMAAPQIGVPRRVCISMGTLYVNPVLTLTKAPPIDTKEGCFSTGRKVYLVQRAPYCWVKYQDAEGNEHNDRVKGIHSIVLQHEVDHLDGLCIPQTGKETVEVIA